MFPTGGRYESRYCDEKAGAIICIEEHHRKKSDMEGRLNDIYLVLKGDINIATFCCQISDWVWRYMSVWRKQWEYVRTDEGPR